METGPLKIITLKFTTLEFHEKFVVSTQFENEILDQKRVDKMVEVCLEFYNDRNFVYIGNRRANYNVDPIIYIPLIEIRPLKGIAIVSQNPAAVNMANFERNFTTLPFEVFMDMEDAQEWAKELV